MVKPHFVQLDEGFALPEHATNKPLEHPRPHNSGRMVSFRKGQDDLDKLLQSSQKNLYRGIRTSKRNPKKRFRPARAGRT